MSQVEKLNTFVSDSFIDTIMGETESIISTVEDFVFENEGTTGLDDFEYIRFISEELQTKVLDFTYSVMNYDTLSEIEDISITLYQHIKYSILDLVETNTFVSDTEDFEYLRCSIDIIRDEIDTLVLQAKN
jgi:hypothetical protein